MLIIMVNDRDFIDPFLSHNVTLCAYTSLDEDTAHGGVGGSLVPQTLFLSK